MKKFISALATLLPHISITISVMYIVFFCINSVNSSMKFLDPRSTPQTFVLLLILSVSSVICSAILIGYGRKIKRLEHDLKDKQNDGKN